MSLLRIFYFNSRWLLNILKLSIFVIYYYSGPIFDALTHRPLLWLLNLSFRLFKYYISSIIGTWSACGCCSYQELHLKIGLLLWFGLGLDVSLRPCWWIALIDLALIQIENWGGTIACVKFFGYCWSVTPFLCHTVSIAIFSRILICLGLFGSHIPGLLAIGIGIFIRVDFLISSNNT